MPLPPAEVAVFTVTDGSGEVLATSELDAEAYAARPQQVIYPAPVRGHVGTTDVKAQTLGSKYAHK